MSDADLSLLLDLHGSQSYDHADRGIGRYIGEHCRELLRTHGAVQRLLLCPTLPFPGHSPPQVLASPLLTWNTATALRTSLAEGARAYHVMSPFEMRADLADLLPPLIADSGLPLMATLYDLIPLLHPDRYLPDPRSRERYEERLALLQRCGLVLAISEHSRQDGIRHAGLDPDRVVNIGAGVSRFFAPASDEHSDRARVVARWPQLSGGFVLTVGGGDPRKQTVELIHAFARIPWPERAPHPLVVAGNLPESMTRGWLAIAAHAGLRRDEVLFTGRIDDTLLRSLYRCATLFVFPSLYEGFGLPVAEAIACGCPALTANTSSLPELLEWPEATFDPRDEGETAEVLRRGLTDIAFRVSLRNRCRERASLFSWRSVGQRTLSAVTAWLGRNSQHVVRDPPRRVALVSAGGSSYAEASDVAAALRESCVVEEHMATVCSGALYDAVIYVDSGEPQKAAKQSAHLHPGIVWLAGDADITAAGAFWGRDARAFVVRSEEASRLLRFASGANRWLPPVFVAAPHEATQLVAAVQATQGRR